MKKIEAENAAIISKQQEQIRILAEQKAKLEASTSSLEKLSAELQEKTAELSKLGEQSGISILNSNKTSEQQEEQYRVFRMKMAEASEQMSANLKVPTSFVGTFSAEQQAGVAKLIQLAKQSRISFMNTNRISEQIANLKLSPSSDCTSSAGPQEKIAALQEEHRISMMNSIEINEQILDHARISNMEAMKNIDQYQEPFRSSMIKALQLSEQLEKQYRASLMKSGEKKADVNESTSDDDEECDSDS